MKNFEAFELCPLDGRYHNIKDILAPYFSEYAYFKYRVFVEVKWLEYLIKEKLVSNSFYQDREKCLQMIEEIHLSFNLESYQKIKEYEKITNHDVKAVEYFLDNILENQGLTSITSFVHFSLTSEDVNNIAYALILKDFFNECYFPKLKDFLNYLNKLIKNNRDIAFLAHTHGQPATPTTVGKEFKVYYYRLNEELKKLKKIAIKAKLNGATGNYNALRVAYPNLDCVSFSKKFVESLNLTFNPLTTQIENHDYIVTILDFIRHVNNIILDLNLDMWLYISKNYFTLEVIKNEVGSSTMPHKVNPINFENSEANLEIANGLLVTLSNKLPRSRMQRDLSDSATLRNLGMSFGYSIKGIQETLKGLKKVRVNKKFITAELSLEWEVLAEAIQTVLRKYGQVDAYDTLKKLTRGKKVTKEILQKFIKNLDISDEDKNNLLNLTPLNYIGLANKL